VGDGGPSALEQAKLEFERERVAIEERGRKRTFVWTVVSGILTAAVTISVAWIGAIGGKDDGERPGVTAVAEQRLVACRDSLSRLISLSELESQTLQALAAAVARHKQACDEVLVDLIAEARQ
jgi:hypothetical protein